MSCLSMALKYVIGLSVAFITIYAASVLVNYLPLALLLVSLSPVVVIWLAYRTLTDPYDTEYTFQDRFYEDHDYQRNSGEEE